MTWLQCPGRGDPAATPSPAGAVPRRRGGRGLLPLPTLPPFPALTPRPLRCPIAGQVPDTHVSRGSSGSSPAGCFPTHSRQKERSGIRVARGPAGRNTWGLCARNRKRPLAPPPGGAGACLGCRRFGPLVVFLLVEAWGSSSETHAGEAFPGLLPSMASPLCGKSTNLLGVGFIVYLLQGFVFIFLVGFGICISTREPAPSHAVFFSFKHGRMEKERFGFECWLLHAQLLQGRQNICLSTLSVLKKAQTIGPRTKNWNVD